MNLRKTCMIILHRNYEKKNLYKKILTDEFILDNISNYSLIPSDLWVEFKDKILKSKKKIGIQINSDENIKLIENDLKKISMIQIHFKTFKDGRPFTLAKTLRRKFNFTKEIRASGHILPDQFVFLLRCGFDSVEIEKKDKNIWLELLEMDNGLYYQP
jgi:uncharacterized protein (DUF934 family)